LFQRAQQLQQLRQNDLFEPVRVADFLIEKDRLFAKLNLDVDEYRLYENVYDHLTIDAPKPDLVIYLQAPVEILLQRIHKRGIASEQMISEEYLANLVNIYTEFFHYFEKSTLLVVNSTDVNFVRSDEDYELLLRHIRGMRTGTRNYFNPRPSLL
jgi:deoxyadenosine/deoxycytidine kinase